MSSENIMLMPAMGEGIIEAKLVRWLKKPGDAVAQDEPIVEVATDKVDSEVPSPFAGILQELFAQEGDQVPVNAPLARIGQGQANAKPPQSGSVGNHFVEGMVAPQAPMRTDSQTASRQGTPLNFSFSPVHQQPMLPLGSDQPVRSSPLVRKIAKEYQVDLQQVSGSGLGGRITRNDIENHLQGKSGPALSSGSGQQSINQVPPATATLAQQPNASDKAETKSENRHPSGLKTQWTGEQEFLDGVRVKRERMSHMRQMIAEHMERSVRTSPHVTTTIEIDLHRVVQIREQHKDSFVGREGFPLTYTAFFIFAAAQAIKQHPIVNVSVDGQDILFKNDINIGVAVSLGSQGLIVPVIKNAGELNLLGIARRLNDIASRARSKRLNPDDVRGGTFSITNPGSYGSLHSNPIISQPQVAMLSIGCITKRPVVLPGDLIGIRPMIILGLTFDHRVIDGEAGAKFLATVRELLETFEEVPV